jgi:hypothetical protein
MHCGEFGDAAAMCFFFCAFLRQGAARNRPICFFFSSFFYVRLFRFLFFSPDELDPAASSIFFLHILGTGRCSWVFFVSI